MSGRLFFCDRNTVRLRERATRLFGGGGGIVGSRSDANCDGLEMIIYRSFVAHVRLTAVATCCRHQRKQTRNLYVTHRSPRQKQQLARLACLSSRSCYELLPAWSIQQNNSKDRKTGQCIE